MVQLTESDYKTAQQGNAKIRQEFLDAIDLEDAAEFVTEKVYQLNSEITRGYPFEGGLISNGKEEIALMTHEGLYSLAYSGRLFVNSIVSIYPEAFDNLTCREFLSCLIDHEGQHSRQFRKRTSAYEMFKEERRTSVEGTWEDDYFRSLLELPAYANQLARAEKRRLSTQTRKRLLE